MHYSRIDDMNIDKCYPAPHPIELLETRVISQMSFWGQESQKDALRRATAADERWNLDLAGALVREFFANHTSIASRDDILQFAIILIHIICVT